MTEVDLIHRVNIGDLLTRSARRYASREMVCDGDRRWSYAEFDAWVNRIAHGLMAQGVRKGDAIGLMSGNRAEFLAVYFACARMGAVCVPINLLWRQAELGYVLGHSEVRAVIVEADHLDALLPNLPQTAEFLGVFVIGGEEAGRQDGIALQPFEGLELDQPTSLPEVAVGDRDPLSYLYTSGTTSAPKGVVGTHLGIYIQSLGTAIDTRMSERDRVSVMLPLFHTAQINAICTPAITVGASLVILPSVDVPRLHQLVEEERLTLLFGLPMVYERLVVLQKSGPRDISSLRLAIYAMAPFTEAMLAEAHQVLDCEFSLLFGQTEMSPVTTFFRPEHQFTHQGAVGTPTINVEVAIMDSDGNLLPTGESGEIVYRGPQTMAEYLRNPEATAEAFRHGWFHSGDAGHFDQDGILWFDDRFKDVIKSGGENVSSIEIEVAIRSIAPEIVDVAVIGLPHPHWGEAITAVIVPPTGEAFDWGAFRHALRSRLSPFKCPKDLILLESLPKTATGKIEKAKLRRAYLQHYASAER